MSHIIAVAGKGGTGKTTTAALLVRLIRDKKLGSCLAVDADPNSNLGECLGVEVKETVGDILDRIAADPDKVPQGWTKERYVEYQVQLALQEEEGFDIISMGRPEGPGCYCYVNNILRAVMLKLVNDYDFVIIDNEAGLEHLSRRTTRSAQVLLVVSDATSVGLKAAERIAKLVKELGIKADKKFLLVNRWHKEPGIDKLKNIDLEFIGNIPFDSEIMQASLNGDSLLKLGKDFAGLKALEDLGGKIWQQK